jgi:taurine dioxygenase
MGIAAANHQTLEVEFPTPNLGAIVTGADLSSELSQEVQDELRDLLMEREVLFLHDQEIEPADHLRFASIFGQPRSVSFYFPRLEESEYIQVLEGYGESSGTDIWHTDHTWQARPPVATCLHSQDLPPVGGDTVWASMTAAYARLSLDMKALLADLRGVHTWEKNIGDYVRGGEDGEERYIKQRAAFPPIEHKVVQIHPVTGKPILFVNDNFTTAIKGLPRAEGDALLEYLVGLARVPEHQVRLRWRPNTVVIWDNRSTQHYAVADYSPHYRRLHRITVEDPDVSFVSLPRA